MIDLKNNTVDLEFFSKVLNEIKNNKELYLDIIDSFSENQFKSKTKLFYILKDLKILNQLNEVAILGSWYGSILIPLLQPLANKIISIDLDDRVIKLSKNRFFSRFNNVMWSTGDIFIKQLNYSNVNLFINTSCEHMKPMKEFPWFNNESYFAVQSNNMNTIEGHINCVYSLNEFRSQLPDNSKILHEEEIEDSRGTRYTIIGQILKVNN